MAHREKPTSPWFGAWSVLPVAGGIWLTKDYVKEGDMFGAVDNVAKAQVRVVQTPPLFTACLRNG